MERFCLERCEGEVQEDLLAAIRGRGAFGRFKAGTAHWGVRDEWHKFQDEALKVEAPDWLELQGIEYGP